MASLVPTSPMPETQAAAFESASILILATSFLALDQFVPDCEGPKSLWDWQETACQPAKGEPLLPAGEAPAPSGIRYNVDTTICLGYLYPYRECLGSFRYSDNRSLLRSEGRTARKLAAKSLCPGTIRLWSHRLSEQSRQHEQPFVEPSRLLLSSCSLHGYSSPQGMLRSKCLISESVVLSCQRFIATYFPAVRTASVQAMAALASVAAGFVHFLPRTP